jgi:hypothetical protein
MLPQPRRRVNAEVIAAQPFQAGQRRIEHNFFGAKLPELKELC